MNAVDQIPNRQETLMHSPEQQALNGGHNGKNQHQSHHVEETDEQDQRLFFALDGSNDGLWDWDMVSDTVYFSPRWLEMIGYQPDELPHTFATWEALVHPDDYVRVERVIQDHIYEDIPYEAEFRMRAKDGQWKWIMARGKVVEHNEQGIPLRMTGVHTDIDQRKREQEELQRNRALLQGMLDALPAVVYVKDLENRLMLANQHWCAATSQSLADAIGKCDEELFPPETVAYWQELTRQVHATGKAVEREEQFPHDDGLHTYVSSQFPLYNEQGELYAIGGIANDITMRKRNEEALRAMNQRLERTFAATPLAMIEINRDGLIRRWNQSAERIFGWSADQALGKHIFPLVVPGFAQEQMQPVLDALLSGQMRNSRNQNITRDGRIITCQWYNAILYDEHETVVGILSQAEDVTAQVERESELQTFLALAHNAPDGIVVSTLNNVVTYLNPAFRQMTGYDESAIGQHIYTFYDEPTEKLAAITEEVRTSQTWQGNITYRRRDGSAFVGQLSIFLIFDHEQKPTAIARIIRDLTEQQQIEAERATLQQQVIDAQQAVLRELSTPLLPIADGVVIMPLIGTIDTQRAQQMMETLLEGVAQYHAKMAILDITGVKVVDTQVANVFIGSAQAVRLLGAQVMITGIQPQIAQTLVQLGADLRGIITRGSLQAGITYALGR